jgi:hypothetical protein
MTCRNCYNYALQDIVRETGLCYFCGNQIHKIGEFSQEMITARTLEDIEYMRNDFETKAMIIIESQLEQEGK